MYHHTLIQQQDILLLRYSQAKATTEPQHQGSAKLKSKLIKLHRYNHNKTIMWLIIYPYFVEHIHTTSSQ